jgi:cation-transporting ATPase E
MNSDFSAMPSVVQEGRRVINNIQRSASLYLVKNIFSFLLSIITLCFALPYPFSPAGLSLVNIVSIGIPSFILAMEPNHNLVTGRFLPGVLYKALPAALADLGLILGILAFYTVLGLDPGSMKAVATGAMGVVGLMMVDRVSRPYTKLRIALIVTMSVFFAVAFLFFKPYFTLPPMGKEAWLVFVVFALLARPAMQFFARWQDQIAELVKKRRKELDL